jgi:hypothetical protein
MDYFIFPKITFFNSKLTRDHSGTWHSTMSFGHQSDLSFSYPLTCPAFRLPDLPQSSFNLATINNRSSDKMQLGLSESLPALVAKRFTAAKETGHLLFSQTHLATIYTSGIPVLYLPSCRSRIGC